MIIVKKETKVHPMHSTLGEFARIAIADKDLIKYTNQIVRVTVETVEA